jgi:hypothetical protein
VSELCEQCDNCPCVCPNQNDDTMTVLYKAVLVSQKLNLMQTEVIAKHESMIHSTRVAVMILYLALLTILIHLVTR